MGSVIDCSILVISAKNIFAAHAADNGAFRMIR